MDKGFWMPKGGAHVTNGDAVFDNSSRLESKRARQWFLDFAEPDLFPSKKQAVEGSSGKLESSIPSSLAWEGSSGFQSVPSVPSQFMDRLFGSETPTPENLGDRNMPISGIDDSNVRKKIDGEQFEDDPSVGLSMSYAMEDPETGVSYGGLRKVKVNQVKDPDNGLHASIEHGIGIGMMEQTYHSGNENTFMSMGQPYGKEGGSVTLMGHSYDIGEANDRSMELAFGKGLDSNISMTHTYNKAENNSISFGGFQGEHVMEASARPLSSYSLLYEQSSAQIPEPPSKKEVDVLNGNVDLRTTQTLKTKVDSAPKSKSESKPARKEAPNSFPSNVRSLIATGMLDGVPVRYVSVSREALNAYEFERHAECKTKHPNNHIYFENGKTIYQIVQELRSTPESMLFDAIQTVTGSPINQKAFRTWKGIELVTSIESSVIAHWHCVFVVIESFQAATRELQRIYGKEELNL
ncbi:hypothetical protein SASPL_101081 [Salvia splendens]|uniref:Tify domain-containing protein n=1 Tax=Salvia splendens TaxID=180675 RepID=A0A8X9AD29_SALSN|nr:hypothetical protein SASPL_101081 [Salvia splendens]